jgi:hypothetical protein
LWWLLLFGGGFYAGVVATQKSVNGPAWVRHLFGVTPPAAPAIATTTAAPQPKATPANPAAPTPPVPDDRAASHVATSGVTGPQRAPRPSEETPAPSRNADSQPDSGASTSAPNSQADDRTLDSQAQEYNDVLRRIQESARNYAAAHRVVADTGTKSQDLQVALDRQNTFVEEIVAGNQRAKSLLASIQDAPDFTEQYVETTPCLTVAEVPASLLNQGVDKLKFLQRR